MSRSGARKVELENRTSKFEFWETWEAERSDFGEYMPGKRVDAVVVRVYPLA